MEVIDIKRYNEVRGLVFGYCAEPSVEAAVQSWTAKTGKVPEKVYRKLLPSGRCTVYIQLEKEDTYDSV